MSSSYFEDASLVLIPEAVGTGTVFSYKPFGGGGDLSFTRTADTATRVGPDGLIEKVRTNLLTYSNDFSNAAWTKINVTLTSGQVDPNGGTNGTRVQYAGVSYINQTPSTAFATASVYVRATSGTASIRISDSTGNSPTQYNLTETWQRISTSGSAMAGMNIDSFIGGSWTAQDVIIAFAQFEAGDIATDYIATTTAAVSVGPVANVPRLDYLNSSCPRLLLEPQRTNLVAYSEQINNWGFIGATANPNVSDSPDGYQSADEVIGDGSSTNVRTYIGVSTSAGVNTFSVFLKSGNTDFAYVQFSGFGSITGTSFAFFDLANGTTPTSGATIQDYGNGWYRCSISATIDASDTSGNVGFSATQSTVSSSFPTAGDANGKYVLAWGAQLEVGAYATSYIPTLGAAVTRGADAASKTGISSLIGQTQGTLFVEVDTAVLGDVFSGYSRRLLTISDGTTTNRINIFQSFSNDSIQLAVTNAGVSQADFSTSANQSGIKKIAVGYANNDFVMYVNGVQIGTDASGSVPACSRVGVGSFETSDNFSNAACPVSQALLFKTRLENDDLAALTSL